MLDEKSKEKSEHIKETKSQAQDQEVLIRYEKNDYVELHVIKDKYKGQEGMTIREYLKLPSYTGYTKKGFRLSIEQFEEIMKLIDEIREKCAQTSNKNESKTETK